MTQRRQQEPICRTRPGKAGRKASRALVRRKGRADLVPPAYLDEFEAPVDIRLRGYDKSRYVRRWIKAGRPRGQLVEFAKDVVRADGKDPNKHTPPYTTLITWANRFEKFGVVGLMDRVRCDAGVRRTVSDDAYQLIRTARIGWKMRSPSAVIRFMVDRGRPTLPPHTVQRVLDDIQSNEPGLCVFVDEGAAAWRAKHRPALTKPLMLAGEEWACDSTVADIWVKVPGGSDPVAMRFALTVIEDVGSRAPVTFNCSMYAIDSHILCGVVRRAVLPHENYPGLGRWNLPKRIRVDGGPDHRKAFTDLMDHHGVEVVVVPDNSPENNGAVERLIGSLQTEVFKPLKGYSPHHKAFNPYAERDEVEVRKFRNVQWDSPKAEVQVDQLHTIEDIEERLLAWFHIYAARAHPRLRYDDPDVARMMALVADATASEAQP
jgi:hypothetical protein